MGSQGSITCCIVNLVLLTFLVPMNAAPQARARGVDLLITKEDPCYLVESCTLKELRCSGQERPDESAEELGGGRLKLSFCLGPEDKFAIVECTVQGGWWTNSEVVADSLESCDTTGYWLPVVAQGSYSHFCTDTECSRSLHGCTSRDELRTRLAKGLDLSTGECQPMDLLATGITTGRSCRGLEGCSHKTRCASQRRLSELISGFDDYYYSASDLDLQIPALSNPTRFSLRANRCGLSFSYAGGQVTSGSFGRLGCLSACDTEECVVMIPEGAAGTLRTFWSIGSSCGSNRDVLLTMSPPTVFGQAIGMGSLRTDITYVKRDELSWTPRDGKLIVKGLVVQQFCEHTEPTSTESHRCSVKGSLMTCSPSPVAVIPEGYLIRHGDTWSIRPELVTSEDCFNVTLCSAVQETVTWCKSGSSWQPVVTVVNSTVASPPSAVPWPDPATSAAPPECSMFNLETCSFIMKLVYLALWALLVFLIYKLIMKIVEKAKEKKANRVTSPPQVMTTQHTAVTPVIASSDPLLRSYSLDLGNDWVYSRMTEI